MTTSRLLFAALAVALLGVAACGGASDSTTGGSSTDKGSRSLSLIGYSTPQVVYDEIIPEFQKTGSGEGASSTRASCRRTGRIRLPRAS